MKKLFFIIIGLCALTLTACEKESIDLSLVSAEVELECIAEEYNTPRSSETSHTFLCSGKVGGFTGLAFIEVWGVKGAIRSVKEIVVAGSETSFSFTFTDSCDEDYDGTPQTFTVTIYADKDKDGYVSQNDSHRVFESSVVIIL